MKFWKLLVLFLVGIAATFSIARMYASLYPSPDISALLSTQFQETCLSIDLSRRPVWECYEVQVDVRPHQEVIVEHQNGEQYRVLTFRSGRDVKFRFTPTQKGTWKFSSGGEVEINADRPVYAKGFVATQGDKWIRTATGEAFVPQFVMYDKPDLDQGLDEFIDGHGFTGFHITNLRDFLDNPSYFEAVVLKTYRRGGATHFWIWGDARREQTPSSYGVDVNLLYTEIAARLAPIPGWSVGYGFDLFEWATAEEIEEFRADLRDSSDYHHMVGGRGHKNEYQEISSALDYASWEWHRPSYEDYKDHLENANQRPAFSEDRFRIRVPSRYPQKDYDPELTLKGLWHSTMAGGVANIWGNQPEARQFSEPYPNKAAIKTYSTFVGNMFSINMEPDNSLIGTGICLRNVTSTAMCYAEGTDFVTLNLEKIEAPVEVIAVDTKSAYEEIIVPVSGKTVDWQSPYASDWAFKIKHQSSQN